MLAQFGRSSSSVACNTLSKVLVTRGLTHVGGHALRRSGIRSFRHLGGHKRTFASGRSAAESDAEGTVRSRGDKIVMVGILLRGAAFLPRLLPYAPALRIAGPAGMFIGSTVSVYELGGWRLVLGIPTTVAGALAAATAADWLQEEEVKAKAISDLHESCPDVPRAAVEALRTVVGCQYETNCLRLEACWPESAPQWRIEVRGKRLNFLQPWRIEDLSVSSVVVDEACLNGQLPPQTRCWDGEKMPTIWRTIWSRH